MEIHGTALPIGTFAELSAAVIRNLPRDISRETALSWINNGKRLQRVLNEVLLEPLTVCNFPVWGMAVMGFYRTAEENIQELRKAGIEIDGRAEEMLRNVDFEQQIDLQQLSIPTVGDLGIVGGGRMHHVRRALLDCGAEFCHPALIPTIALFAKEHGYKFHCASIIMLETTLEDAAGDAGGIAIAEEDGKIHLLSTESWTQRGFFDPEVRCMCVRPLQTS
jgi:hypothetical protein